MRWIAWTSLIAVAVAACGGGGGEQNKAATKAASLAAGQWELASEVTAFNKADQGTPKINTPVGTRSTETLCVGAERPPASFFSGADIDCRYDSYYARNGRLTATMICNRQGLDGNISMTVDGRFEEDSTEFTRDVVTNLATDGDVRVTARVTGRRTGDCPAESGGNNAAAADAD